MFHLLLYQNNVNLTEQLNEGFKRPVYWNEYNSKIVTKKLDNGSLTRFPLDASFQGVNRLFVLAFNNTGQGDYYTTGCLLDYQYFKYHYQPISVDLSKQKKLAADPRAIQQIESYGMLNTNLKQFQMKI